MDLMGKVEETYRNHRSEPREKQIDCLMKSFEDVGLSTDEVVDYCIARIESQNSKRTRLESTVFGLAYPAIVLFLSSVIILLQYFNSTYVVCFAAISFLVSVVMLVTYRMLEKRNSKDELIERLYDVKEKLLISSKEFSSK